MKNYGSATDEQVPGRSAWFDGDQKPPEPGVYEADWQTVGTYFNKWDGLRWHYGDLNIEAAARESDPHPEKPRRWRGLAEKP